MNTNTKNVGCFLPVLQMVYFAVRDGVRRSRYRRQELARRERRRRMRSEHMLRRAR